MKNYLKVAISLSALAASPAFAQNNDDDGYRPWVNIRDGEVTVAFNDTPVSFALDAFHAQTGFNIVVPPSAQSQILNLRFDRQPIEPAVRSLISTIGFDNFALVYDQEGRPHSAVVLGAQPIPAAVANSSANNDDPSSPLGSEERDRMKRDLDRWNELRQEERGRIEERLRNAPSSDDREILFREYGRQLLGVK